MKVQSTGLTPSLAEDPMRPCCAVLAGLSLLLAAAGRSRAEAIVSPPVEFYKTVAPESQPAPKSPGPPEGAITSDEWEKAVAAFRQGRFSDSLELFAAASKRDSTLPPPRLMLARLFLAGGHSAQGRAALEQAAAETPAYPGVYLTFAQLALAEGRATDALLHYEKALALCNSAAVSERTKRYVQAQSSAGRAAVAEARQDWETAHAHLLVLLKDEPNNGKARQRLGRALFFMKKPAEAMEQLEQAVKDDATLESAAVSMARLYAQQGDRQKADEWMQAAVKKDPRDVRVQSALASWLLDRGRLAQATEHAEAAARVAPASNEVKLLLAECARHARDFAKAERHFEEVCRAEPGSLRASNGLALTLVEQPDTAKRGRALELAEVNVRQYPQLVEALSTLGWVHYRLGRLQSAEGLLNKAVSGGTVTSDTAYFLARCLADQGRLGDARKILLGAVATEGRFAFRAEAEKWLEQSTKEPLQSAGKTDTR